VGGNVRPRMNLGGGDILSQELIQMLAVAGGLFLTVVFGFLLVRRARATRRRQIEGAETPALPEPRRRKGDVPPRDVEPEGEDERQVQEVAEEAPVAPPKPEARKDKPREARTKREKVEPPPAPAQDERKPVPVPVQLKEERPTEPPPPQKRRKSEALAPGLARTRSGWISKLGELFAGKREIDADLLDQIEKVLLTADIGVRTASKLLEEMRSSLSRRELSDPESAWAFLQRRTQELLSLGAKPIDWSAARPMVLLIIGVNGSGKTTTIGKLASRLIADGKKVLVGAGDTFRAAAAEQLEIWANRVGATLVRGKEGADPSSVLFDSVKRGVNEAFDVIICDTAGRLHTKTDLMEELQKVRRVIAKAAPGAPHETWLVIDSTSGQNAIAQAQIFTQAMAVSGIVLTKLDGTAKGGVILGIADQLQIPVRFIGIGERVEDLREFDAEEFVEALYERTPGDAAVSVTGAR